MKALISVNGVTDIVAPEKAIEVLSAVEGAEEYQEKWRSKTDGGTTFHVFHSPRNAEPHNLQLVSDDLYRMAKLAGAPEK